MKIILKNTLYLIVFAIAGIIFQISCSNSDSQKTTNTLLQNKVIYTIFNSTEHSIWTCDYDGTNLVQVPISLPSNVTFNTSNGNADAKISPNGQKIFFIVTNINTGGNEIYSCDVNGGNVQQVIAPPSVPSTIKINLN